MVRRTTSTSRGRLSASVYWRRRLAVLSIGVLLVVGLTRLLAGGGGGHPGDTASPVARAGKPVVTVTVTPTPPAKSKAPKQPASTAPATPTGPCSASDISVTPVLKDAYAYGNVTIPLQLRTLKSPACTWRVSADALQVRISAKSGGLAWSTVDCPAAVPTKDIVVRHETTVTLPLVWTGRRVVAGECTSHGPWVKPNLFTVVASSLGGEPATADFGLYEPGAVLAHSEPNSAPSPASSSAPTP